MKRFLAFAMIAALGLLKPMDRKRCTRGLMAVLALDLWNLQLVVAQVLPQGNHNFGTFGNRTLVH